MERIDRKFNIEATKVKDGKRVTHSEAVLLLAKDNATLPTLQFYHSECERLGADEVQLKAVRLLIARVEKWRATHPKK